MSKIVANKEAVVSNKNEFTVKLGWWGVRLLKYAKSRDDIEGLEKCKDALLNDFTAWIVFVALLMTVDFAALFISPLNYKENLDDSHVNTCLMYVYITSFSLAAVASISAAYSGIQGYNFYNGLPAAMLDMAIDAGSDMTHPVMYGATAAVSTMIGTTIGIYLLFGFISAIISGAIFTLGIIEHFRITAYYNRSLSRLPGLDPLEIVKGSKSFF